MAAAAVVFGVGAASIPVASAAAAGRNRIGASDVTRSLRASFTPNLGACSGQSEERKQEVAGRSLRWQPVEQQQQEEGVGRAAKSRERWRARSSASKAASVTEGQFEAEVLKSSIPVLVDFWAPWCGPCRLMGISLDWAAEKYAGKIKCVKIDTDSNGKLVEDYGVYGLPTIILFVDGEAVISTKKEGALNKDKLQAYIEENLPALAPAS